MTKSTITRERLQELAEGQSGFNLRIATHEESQELARIALAALDTEPVGEFYEDGPLNWYQISDGDRVPAHRRIPLYRHAQPVPVVEREPIAWLNDAYLARGVVDGEAGSEDAGPGYIPVYREAGPQPAPVVPEEKLIPNTLSMYAVDAVAAIAEVKGWNACRAAMLQAGNSPVIPEGYVMVPKEPTAEMQSAGASAIRIETTALNKLWTGNAVFRAMLAASPQEDINALIPLVSRNEREVK